LITFTEEAERQIDRLRSYYIDKVRSGALRNFSAALRAAFNEIEHNPSIGKAAPGPYPDLAQPGRAWIKSGRYWVVYSTIKPIVIVGVFYETADIPNRL
jgi:plasmid stabilization system protein ParE